MKVVKNMFAEFKSVFVTKDILKENERHANVVTATTMLNLFLVIFVSWVLSRVSVFKTEPINLTYVVTNSFIGLFIPAIICFVFKGNKSWMKYVLLGSFIIVLGSLDNNLTYTTALLMVIPVILSARYYKKDFTIFMSALTFLTFMISALISGKEYIVNTQEVVSVLLLYYVVVFAGTQISQSGKKMIEKQEEITKKGTRIETELNLANSIQKHMLPSIFPPFPEHDEIDIYAQMIPAKEVGGDFYDMFLLDENHLVIEVADVSGKGIPAALFMMIAKILIKNVAGIEKSVDQVFNKVNKMLCEGNKEDIFITSWLGLLDLKSGKLEFVNAGHNPPLIYHEEKGEYEFLKTEPNMVMACFENATYEKHEIYIKPNDRIFLYTDGVVESTNDKKELFGEKRLKEFLNNNLSLSPKENINELIKEIYSFSENTEQFDDITVLQLNYEKKDNHIEKEFIASKEEMPNVQNFVLNELNKNNYSKKIINQILLVVEEIFTNIFKYAYKDKKGNCKIIINSSDNEFKCVFEDTGIPFNPLNEKEPDLSIPSKNRKVGGLGIYISKMVMDKMNYKYENGKNILTIVKKVKGE